MFTSKWTELLTTIQENIHNPSPHSQTGNAQIQGSSFRKSLPLKKKQAHFELLVFAFLALNSSSWTNWNSKTLVVKKQLSCNWPSWSSYKEPVEEFEEGDETKSKTESKKSPNIADKVDHRHSERPLELWGWKM